MVSMCWLGQPCALETCGQTNMGNFNLEYLKGVNRPKINVLTQFGVLCTALHMRIPCPLGDFSWYNSAQWDAKV